MKIALARAMTSKWLAASELARDIYRKTYGATVLPAPDAFIVAEPADPPGPGAADDGEQMLACAGLTFGTDRPLFSERYLDRPVEDEIAERFGARPDRRRVVEVGALATRQRSVGGEVIRATPIVAWCLGMEYILCTVTSSLVVGLDRAGIEFTPFGPADPDRLDPGDDARWGSYYDHKPQVGVIQLNSLHRLFSAATGRYLFTDMELNLIGDQGATHANR
ncbi:thermostable hemolysin [Kitasatospora phosalacinea]|uniref:Thermostable hemolysin n=1 Tax=Kitasatospora phosalacinea TaxID=2065 RepID=A0A9W6Q7N7_9ACTN|nr:thermostable hemolysin [Kitasatospora phosalacinea]GLW71410.1 thermostable hemolysin [Kitasatospora phosalacinea]